MDKEKAENGLVLGIPFFFVGIFLIIVMVLPQAQIDNLGLPMSIMVRVVVIIVSIVIILYSIILFLNYQDYKKSESEEE
jgi:hypothetical protein